MNYNAMTARVADLQMLHPLARDQFVKLDAAIRSHRLPFDVFETFRTPHRQAELFAKGGVTAAKGFQSAHQYGLAADFVGFVDGQWSWKDDLPWSALKGLAELYGLEVPIGWDKGHVVHPQWFLARDLLAGMYH